MDEKLEDKKLKGKILVVDDQEMSVTFLSRILEKYGYSTVTAYDGIQALDKFNKERPDIILLDIMMPNMNGFDVCKTIKDDPNNRMIPIIMITALSDSEDKIRAIDCGADDFINKPFDKLELLARINSLLRIKHLNDQLENAENILFSMARILELKDPFTKGHIDRTTELAVKLGKHIDLSKEELDNLRKGAMLHDIGKIVIPDSILSKYENLTEAETEIVKKHPVLGYEICKPMISLKETLPVIRSHHERIDGTGYPDGLKGEEIPLIARIMSVADNYDSLVYHKSYSLGVPASEAIMHLISDADRNILDRKVVEKLIDIIKEQ